ncbi:ERF family protein [Thioalkalivibrio sp. ALMg11]|uniref:ERF family protein n=1 Tax=Thioalkalivibrio sp. ALMg11 TaxID=1158165 RepID=UPI0003796990|nr:ERF family protein [Thioalkalivibrio sp. ALMg11]
MQQTREMNPDFMAAFAKAQGEMENAVKNAENLHLKNKYADLSAVLQAIRPVLSRHGLFITQWIETLPGSIDNESGEVTQGGDYLRTILGHASGGFIESMVMLRVPTGNGKTPGPQLFGSVVTYMRRYQALAVAGIAADDDDGASASAVVAAESAQPVISPEAKEPPDDLVQRIRGIDTATKAATARQWLTSADTGISEEARKKALQMLDEQEKKIANQGDQQSAVA